MLFANFHLGSNNYDENSYKPIHCENDMYAACFENFTWQQTNRSDDCYEKNVNIK